MNKKDQILKFVIVAIVIFIIVNNFIFSPGNILSWDVFGYYLYLPLKFIYNDLGLKDSSIINGILEKYHNTATFYQAMKMPDGNFVMKYSMGLSFFYAPFFFIGHVIAKMFNYTADGFSLPYQYSIFIGGIIYSLIGIWVLSKVLARFFDQTIVALVLLIIVFSTNYIVHITMYGQNAMSQNYLFMAYALILWFTILWHESHKLKYAVFLGFICGLTILSRPSEVVCLIIPVLWGIKDGNSIKDKFLVLYKYRVHVIVVASIIALFGLSQMIYWKIYTGKFLFYSYGGNAGEGFDFFHPYIWEVLFSFRKGWLIYTPVMLFALTGFYFMYKKNRAVFYALFAYVVINIYFVSSWSCWWYAQSFSQRALVASYPVMAIGLGYFLAWLNAQKSILKGLGYLLLLSCLLLNLYQSRQFHFGIID
ncbi:MAG: glycosyltransferase family 39 protein, partial [Bacteroidales bacterium]